MAGDVRIDLARIKDAGAIALASRDLVEAGLPWRWTPRAVARAIRHPETEVVVARRRGRVAGFALMRLEPTEAHLLLFAVLPEHRRRGVGRALFGWLEALVETAGLERVLLEVRTTNQAAQRFYRELGFVSRRLLPYYYQGLEHAVQMERRYGRRAPSAS